jgi:hypothetical protein
MRRELSSASEGFEQSLAGCSNQRPSLGKPGRTVGNEKMAATVSDKKSETGYFAGEMNEPM